MSHTLALPDIAQRRERDDGSRQHAYGGQHRHRIKSVAEGFPGKGQQGPARVTGQQRGRINRPPACSAPSAPAPSAGRWLASENRQLSIESTLEGGPRFAAGDICGAEMAVA